MACGFRVRVEGNELGTNYGAIPRRYSCPGLELFEGAGAQVEFGHGVYQAASEADIGVLEAVAEKSLRNGVFLRNVPLGTRIAARIILSKTSCDVSEKHEVIQAVYH